MGRGDIKTKVLVLVAAAVGVLVFNGGVAMATNPVGFTSVKVAQGRLAKPIEISKNGIEFSTRGQTDVLVQTVTLDFPVGNTGWHMHPGLTVVTVIKGTVRFHSGCDSGLYSAGAINQSFVEPPMTPVFVENTSSTDTAIVVGTLIVPKHNPPVFKLDAPAPDCTDGDSSKSD